MVSIISKPKSPTIIPPVSMADAKRDDHKSVDFTNVRSYSFTLPVQFTYFGELHAVKSWKDVYIGVLQCLFEDYPNVFRKLKNQPVDNSRVPIIYEKANSKALHTPVFIGDDLYVETNRRTDHFIRCMKILLDLCNVDYENVVIEYDELQKESSAQVEKETRFEDIASSKTINDDFVDQTAFYTYLMDVQKMSESTCRGYVSALKRAEQFARDEGFEYSKLLDCSKTEAEQTIAALKGNNKFRAFNDQQHRRFSAAIAKLISFLSIHQKNADEDKSTLGLCKQNEKIEAVSSDDSVSSNEIVSFLKGDEFAALREALACHHITTLEELKSLKLWAFMNRYNIYSIGTRQKIFSKVNAMLYPTVDLNDAQAYVLHIGDDKYKGTTPAEAFLSFCGDMLTRYPLQFRMLIGARMLNSNAVPVRKGDNESHALQLTNSCAFISETLSVEDVVLYTKWVRNRCGEGKIDITMSEPQNTNVSMESILKDGSSEKNTGICTFETVLPSVDSSKRNDVDIEKMEQFVMEADIQGIPYEELKKHLFTTMVATKYAVAHSIHIVDVNGKLIHEDSFIEWEDGANRLEAIMDKLMQKNRGYISAAQLYEYAKMEMNMFLTDNDVNDERAVYDIAEHLFKKEGYHNKRFSFYGKMHISRLEHPVISNLDIFRNYAADQGGVFSFESLVEYLQRIGVSTGNLRAQMRVADEPIFFYYDDGILMCADDMHIDEEWKATVKKELAILLTDVGSYIVLRKIPEMWLEHLPILPGRKPWTPLLLQSILRCYHEELGAKTIQAMSGQSIDTLHTMLVTNDSPIQSFGDVVISYLIDNEITQRSFEAEELRLLLVEADIIHGNELIWKMPKALDKDERFAWDASGDRVIVEV